MSGQSLAEVLLVDRDPDVGQEIISSLSARNYGVEWVDDGEKAYNCLDNRLFDVMVTELNLRRVDGMRLMGVAKERNPDICVIMITEHPDIELATEAMRQGAYDFQTKPLNLGKLEAVIERGLDYQKLLYEQVQLKRRLDERYRMGNLIGRSKAIVRAYSRVRQAAPTRAPIVLIGEAGTGKHLVGQTIHNLSPRRDAAFVKLSCAGASETTLRQELLGQGDVAAMEGRMELAHQGSLYLEEVEELPSSLQQVLLDVLTSRRAHRLEDDRSTPADFRLVVALSPQSAERGTIRPFLDSLRSVFDGVTVELPPLRDRREDIPALVAYFIEEACGSRQKSVDGISRNALGLLSQYGWPENVRELRNVVDGMVLSTKAGRPLDVMDVPAHVRDCTEGAWDIKIPIGASMSEVERIVIEETLKTCGYKKELCAKTLGIGLRTLYRKLKEYETS